MNDYERLNEINHAINLAKEKWRSATSLHEKVVQRLMLHSYERQRYYFYLSIGMQPDWNPDNEVEDFI